MTGAANTGCANLGGAGTPLSERYPLVRGGAFVPLHPFNFAVFTLAGVRLHGNDLLALLGLSQGNHLPSGVRTTLPRGLHHGEMKYGRCPRTTHIIYGYLFVVKSLVNRHPQGAIRG